MNKPPSSTLPIALRQADRSLLQAAAAQLGLAESTYVRQMAVAVARLQLEPARTEPAEADE